MVSGTLLSKNYANFTGVDFSDPEVSIYRSPDALNVWRNYEQSGNCIETRPGIEKIDSFEQSIFGLFFYKPADIEMMLVHSGTKLYKVVNGEKTVLFEGMNPVRSQAFIFNNIFYIKDGINYIQFDGKNCGEVVGYIPTTTIGRKPLGGGTTLEDVNMLSPYRKNTFLADGESKEFYLDAENIDGDVPIVIVGTDEKHYPDDFDYDIEKGKITFVEAPPAPLTDGQDTVTIIFKKTVVGHADRIKRCNLLAIFDNRVFFSGNPNYPNTLWHCSLEDPTYCSDLDYYNEGMDMANIKAMVPGNNALWVFKESSQANTCVFYHNPAIDSNYGKVYPSTHSSVSIGCEASAINFNDDIVMFSDRGMEAINGDITTEQVLCHRSTLIDSKLLSEKNYKNMILEEWKGYLLVIIDNVVYLANSNSIFQKENHAEYEWFYWQLKKNITCTKVKDGILYLGTDDGIYTLTDFSDDREIESYWVTPKDEFGYPQYQKTTNKRGCVLDLEGKEFNILSKIDENDYEELDYEQTNRYVVCRIKMKKWKSIQLKVSSSKPFKFYSGTLEVYIGGYLKR